MNKSKILVTLLRERDFLAERCIIYWQGSDEWPPLLTGTAILLLGATLVTTRYWKQIVRNVLCGRRDGDWEKQTYNYRREAREGKGKGRRAYLYNKSHDLVYTSCTRATPLLDYQIDTEDDLLGQQGGEAEGGKRDDEHLHSRTNSREIGETGSVRAEELKLTKIKNNKKRNRTGAWMKLAKDQ